MSHPIEDDRDDPIDVVEARALRIMDEGGVVYQKWTCQGCGERVTGDNPNALFAWGKHDEKGNGEPCGHVTDLMKHGCGLLAIYSNRRPPR